MATQEARVDLKTFIDELPGKLVERQNHVGENRSIQLINQNLFNAISCPCLDAESFVKSRVEME